MRQDNLHTLPDGRTLAWGDYGEPMGHPLVFCHGAPGSRTHVSPAMDATAAALGLRLLVPDRPGYGRSTPLPGRTFPVWIQDLANLLDALGIGAITVLGFSVGTIQAMACAHGMSGRVINLGLAGTLVPRLDLHHAGMAPDVIALFKAGQGGPEGLALALEPLRGVPEALLEGMAASMPPPDQAVLADPDLGPAFRSACLEALRQGGTGMAEDIALATADWGFDPGGLGLPVQLWHGSEDRNSPPSMAQALMAMLPSGRLDLLSGEGHLCLYSHWEPILRALLIVG